MTALLDPDRLIGTPLPGVVTAWSDTDVMLYHLGVGAGVPPDSPAELRYVYERDLVVLPSFPSVACSEGLRGFRTVPGLDLADVVVLHAEHLVEVTGPIPTAAEVEHTGRLADLIDRGRAALALFEVETRERGTGKLLFRNLVTFHLRGLGGFSTQAANGGRKGGGTPRLTAPERGADRTVSVPLLPQQAFIYRLCGDRNPLHVDPDVAAKAGFERPLLHGLCTYGVVCKAVVDQMLDGRVEQVRSYRGKFTGYVYPGETLEISLWDDGGQVIAAATTRERGTSVIVSSAVIA